MVVRCLCSIGCVCVCALFWIYRGNTLVGLCARSEVNVETHEWRGTRVQGIVGTLYTFVRQTKSSHNAENLIIYDVRAKCENNVVLHLKLTRCTFYSLAFDSLPPIVDNGKNCHWRMRDCCYAAHKCSIPFQCKIFGQIVSSPFHRIECTAKRANESSTSHCVPLKL